MTDYADSKLRIAQLRANLPLLAEVFATVTEQYPLVAKQYHAYLVALIEAGFCRAEALDIVKTHGVFPRMGGDASPGPKGL